MVHILKRGHRDSPLGPVKGEQLRVRESKMPVPSTPSKGEGGGFVSLKQLCCCTYMFGLLSAGVSF